MNVAVPLTMLALISFGGSVPPLAHCEMPCGIYGDQMRFDSMLEDQATIRKAMEQIQALAGKNDAQSANQLARWVMTKEEHATDIEHTIAQYFMTQRIKADDERYIPKLTSAHAVMVAAMKAKQTVDVAQADALNEAILSFQAAYGAK